MRRYDEASDESDVDVDRRSDRRAARRDDFFSGSRYRSISITNFMRIHTVLTVLLFPSLLGFVISCVL